ncbi:hypothetical protein [Chryseobacterium caseinilyticum]|uniref:Uncharacterized protein n=1 Tax=Chryseobacterium caseinilyticum TaxID=2771428 RepID=A0ABR8ZBM2_9FLAO|nr:hypothetical protein [Chryseobacterium caseinilyticum]MBD8082166.1 hypothetical protein [Chryseobacterium caseinilyticum]
MKSIKITLDQNVEAENIKMLLSQIKGISSVEIIDEENPESELKKAFEKTKEQFKKGDYETLVNDIFTILTKK